MNPHYEAASVEMPRYISCKPVWALKIAAIEPGPTLSSMEGGSWFLRFENTAYGLLEVSHDWVTKRGAQVGGYYIVYEDGYKTWSPADAFERGCTPAAEWGIPRAQEPKFGVNLRGKLFNRDTGQEVPDDEPLFVGRARDLAMLPTIKAYRETLPIGSPNTRSVDERMLAFSAFRELHPGRMKWPDGVGAYRRQMPPEPHSMNAKPRAELDPQKWAPGDREGT